MAAAASDTRFVIQVELKPAESWCDKTCPAPSPVGLLRAGSFATDSDDHDRQQQVRIVALWDLVRRTLLWCCCQHDDRFGVLYGLSFLSVISMLIQNSAAPSVQMSAMCKLLPFVSVLSETFTLINVTR